MKVTLRVNGETVERIGDDDLAGKARVASNMGGEIEQIFFLLAGRRQPCEILGRDDDMAGGTGHLPLARAFEWLAIGLGDVEQGFARRRIDLAHSMAVSGDEANSGHATKLNWRSAASSIMRRASSSSSSPV